MKKKASIKLLLKAGLANPSPPVGPALGAYGINLQEFCKLFNLQSLSIENIQKGDLVTALVTIFDDKTFNIILKTTPTTELIKKAANISSGSKNPKKIPVASLTKEDIMRIAVLKKHDIYATTVEKLEKTVIGTALSMGILVKH